MQGTTIQNYQIVLVDLNLTHFPSSKPISATFQFWYLPPTALPSQKFRNTWTLPVLCVSPIVLLNFAAGSMHIAKFLVMFIPLPFLFQQVTTVHILLPQCGTVPLVLHRSARK